MSVLRQSLKFLKRHLFPAICCVIVIAGTVVFILRMDLLEQARSEAGSLQKEAENMKRNLRNASGLREQLAQLNGMLATIDARLVHPEDLAGNLQYFYRLESETGIKILLLRQMTGTGPATAAPAAKKTFYRPVPYNVIVEGSFPQVMTFLGRLERGTHFNRIPVFTAQRGATDSPDGMRSGTVVTNLSIELLGTP